MSYWERAPDPRLAACVERISFSLDPPGRASAPIRVVPDGRIDLLISVDARGRGRADTFGVKTTALFARSETPVANVALTFRPGAAPALLGVPAHELTDRVVGADEFLGRETVARLLAAAGLRARAALLEEVLLSRLPDAPSEGMECVRQVAEAIERRGGNVRIPALAREFGFGERRLERAFRARVGIGPKRFARIARFGRAYRALALGARPLEVALARGYFDQPHLVRDFVAFAGDAPRRIFPS